VLIVVLVLSVRDPKPPYPRLLDTIRTTWAAAPVPDVETLFYSGGPALDVRGSDLVVPAADDLLNVGHKTLRCFEYLLENREFDLVFRTNLSSYVDLANLREYARTQAQDGPLYRGILGMRDSTPYASGSGYFLSRELVELAVEAQELWNHKLPDDAALGFVLAARGVEPSPGLRQDIARLRDARTVDTTQYHVRCRTDSWRRYQDALIMRRVHRAFRDARAAS
jgi:hypothetical protein